MINTKVEGKPFSEKNMLDPSEKEDGVVFILSTHKRASDDVLRAVWL